MMCFRFPRFTRALLMVSYCSLMGACGAVYPEVATPVRSAPAGREVEPEPPANMLYLDFESAVIPRQTRDGRKWDSVGGNAPDPFAKVLVDEVEIIKTPTEENTLHPTWPDQVRANYVINRGSKVVVEVWDSNPLNNAPICRIDVDFIHDKAGEEPSELLCNSGARVVLRVDHAHPKIGLGLYYELQSQSVKVTRVIAQSPASRAGLGPGTEIVSIQGKPVDKLDPDQIRSLINANGQVGLQLDIKQPDGTPQHIELKEAAMYPNISEGIRFDQ